MHDCGLLLLEDPAKDSEASVVTANQTEVVEILDRGLSLGLEHGIERKVDNGDPNLGLFQEPEQLAVIAAALPQVLFDDEENLHGIRLTYLSPEGTESGQNVAEMTAHADRTSVKRRVAQPRLRPTACQNGGCSEKRISSRAQWSIMVRISSWLNLCSRGVPNRSSASFRIIRRL